MSFFDFEDSYSTNKESSFFTDDVNDNRAGEKRSVNCFDDDNGEDKTNSSDVQMKSPKMCKVDHILSPVKPVNSPEAHLTGKDKPDVNDNSSVKEVKEDTSPLSNIMRDAIEEMRSKMLSMIPDIKRQEEVSDSIVGRATVLESDINNYREQLAEVKHEYTSRLNQVSSILNMHCPL